MTAHKDTDFASKEFADVKTQIKLLLFQIKQKVELQKWMQNLRRGTKITVDPDQLQISSENKEAR